MQQINHIQHPIPREQFLREYLEARQPVVIETRSLADLGWHTDRWTDDYFVDRAGAQKVIVQTREEGGFGTSGTGRDKIRMPFAQFIRGAMAKEQGNQSWYLNTQTMTQVVEPPLLQLQDDFSLPEYFSDRTLRWISVWMGNNPAGFNRSQLHNDNHDNLYVMIRGRKRFTIFKPEDGHNLYTHGKIVAIEPSGRVIYEPIDDLHLSQFSRLNIASVDLDKYPLFANAEAFQAELNANDMLFLPAGWYHEVHSYGKNIALNFWVNPPGVESE